MFSHLLVSEMLFLCSTFYLLQSLSELGAQELREREDYLKQKRDALMALKKESKINLAPQNTDKQEVLLSSNKEVMDERMYFSLA